MTLFCLLNARPMRARGVWLAFGIAMCLFSVAMLHGQEKSAAASRELISLTDFKGYESWPVIAPSTTDSVIKSIAGNRRMIESYAKGIPTNGGVVPDGAMMVKVTWTKKSNPFLAAGGNVPDALRRVQFMVKDAKRFAETDGWGYAEMSYETPAGTFRPLSNNAAQARAACHQCHVTVKARDYVFTEYAKR